MPGGGSTSGDASCQRHQELSSGQDTAFGEIPSVPERAEQAHGAATEPVTGSEHLVCRWHWQARVLAQ